MRGLELSNSFTFFIYWRIIVCYLKICLGLKIHLLVALDYSKTGATIFRSKDIITENCEMGLFSKVNKLEKVDFGDAELNAIYEKGLNDGKEYGQMDEAIQGILFAAGGLAVYYIGRRALNRTNKELNEVIKEGQFDSFEKLLEEK